MRDFPFLPKKRNHCSEQHVLLSSQLTALRGESVSAKTLQGTIQALEREKANLQEHVQRLEQDLAAGPENITSSSGDTGLNSSRLQISLRVSDQHHCFSIRADVHSAQLSGTEPESLPLIQEHKY